MVFKNPHGYHLLRTPVSFGKIQFKQKYHSAFLLETSFYRTHIPNCLLLENSLQGSLTLRLVPNTSCSPYFDFFICKKPYPKILSPSLRGILSLELVIVWNKIFQGCVPVSYTHLDVYKRQFQEYVLQCLNPSATPLALVQQNK